MFKKRKDKKMQNNETDMGYAETSNRISKKKHVHIFCMFQKNLLVALEIAFFPFQSIFQDFRRS